jgi:hypothetical protein
VDISNADDNTIGGTATGARNIISGNDDGVVIFGAGTTGNKVEGNRIGTNAAGNAAIGNSDGIVISSASDNFVGGTASGAGNLIANNVGDGVLVAGGAALGNRVLSNSISANGELGIDLGTEGVTANDPDDPDCASNSNHCQNFPVITSAIKFSTGFTIITGTLNSNPSQSFTIQCFVADGDPSGHGEGQIPVGQTTAVTNDDGDTSFTCPANPIPQVNQTVTVTATNTATGDTSEFSENVRVS